MIDVFIITYLQKAFTVIQKSAHGSDSAKVGDNKKNNNSELEKV